MQIGVEGLVLVPLSAGQVLKECDMALAKMKNIKSKLLFVFLSAGLAASAQERLTLQDAIQRTLKKNFDVSIAGLSAQQAARNNTYGNAGFLPYVFFTPSISGSQNNVHSDLVNGTSQNNPHAKSLNYNPAVTVNWTIYDGGKMFLVKKQLGKIEEMGKVQLQSQIQTMVSRAIQMYSQVVWRQKQVVAIDTALQLARVRMEIAYRKFETGAGAKIDYLQARVDYNSRQSDSLTYIANLAQASDSLSVLMGEQDNKTYIVDDSLVLNTKLVPVDRARLAELNQSLRSYKYNAEISHMNEDISKTYFLPTLSFNGALAYSRTTNSTGFALFNQTYGGSGGLTLSLPLYEGDNLRRQAKVASLQAMKDDLLYERQNTILGKQYRTAWNNYRVAVAAYHLEHENIGIAKENLDVQIARFRVGVGSTLEARQAENDYISALVRLYTASYNLKVCETVVLELQNQLVRD